MAWAPDYATDRELASYLRIGDANDDQELGLAVTGASRAIDHATNRQFGKVDSAEARTFEARWSRTRGAYVVEIEDLMTLDSLDVVVAGSSLASSAYQILPVNAAAEGMPWTRLLVESATSPTIGTGPCTVAVTAEWGWAAVPDTIVNACLLQASRLFQRRNAPFGVAGSPDLGSEVRLLAKIDPDVETLVRPYRRNHPMVLG